MKRDTSLAARRDIMRQFSHYLSLDLPDIAEQFLIAVETSMDAVMAAPHAGAPKALRNPKLAGLRTWPVKKFDEFKIYYLTDAETLLIVRILHGRRDIRRILEDET